MGSDPVTKNARGSDPLHYSYTSYADPAVAAGFDAMRFGGPIGALLREDQEGVLDRFLGDVSGQRLLDVGTGTGRAALALSRRGARVTGIDASHEMLGVARARATQAGLDITFECRDAHRLMFPDRYFEKSVCLRVLMHTPDWQRCLGELCRVTERQIVFDYPALSSIAVLQSLFRRLIQKAGRRTEAYRVFADSTIRHALDANGFRITESHRQFVLPIALHKLIGSPAFTRKVELAFGAVGLRRLAGSPVTVLAQRCGS